MNQADLLARVVDVLEARDIPYAVGGSLASGAYGEPRMTVDIDIVVDMRSSDVHGFCSEFPSPEYYVSLEAAQDAVRRQAQFNVIHTASGNKVDVIVAKPDAWNRAQFAHRRRVPILPDRQVYVASPEDVIISKMAFYDKGGSEKHLRDIAGILRVQGAAVDREYIGHWAEELHLRDVWRAVLQRLQSAEG